MFDWQDMRCFLAAAKVGSLTGAAVELGVDHATIGRRVAKLEAAIGVKLIHRLPRSMQLTDQGAALLAAAGPMGDSAEAIGRHLRGQVEGLCGRVTVSALPALAAFVIAPRLPRLCEEHPGLRLILSATSMVASLERGDADIAIGFVRPALAGRIVRRIGNLRFSLYGAAAMAAQRPEDWQFVGFEESLAGIVQQTWLDDFALARPFVLRTNDVTTQLAATRAGLGAALLPCILADADGGLVRLDTDRPPPSRPLWMSVHGDVRRSPVVRVVMDHMIRTFAD
ncbi:LysR family transcriptional regulator [Sphingomonas sp. RP10(2022)]|uniref:LysR family transcriptional regulator n=1 Tax=Sphingomonas liriopis TaxID=2949094 RepID=A0A9X2KSA3_9SPHN|nr:LysR family transcriptional regulator [Sphingomonas liriopis]MCP3733588.1 LysR family transcriptional regulator [Sphingomonas liriopis]